MPMTGFSDTWEQAILDYLFRGTAIANLPAVDGNYYLALMTAAPNEDKTGGTEVSAADYVRLALKRGTTGDVMGAAAQDGSGEFAESKNATELAWAQATNNWGTIVGVMICEGSTKAQTDFVKYCPLTASVAINTNDTFKLPIDNLIAKLK